MRIAPPSLRCSMYGLALLVAFAACTPSPPPTNLLIVSVDTLRADAIGAAGYGAARTPNIDRLAAEGTTFTQAIAPIPRTTPALGSLLTGLWPQGHGSREVGDPIVEEVVTLAQVLAARGYATRAMSANLSAGPKQRLDRGFERFTTYTDLLTRYEDRLFKDWVPEPDAAVGWATATREQALALVADVPAAQPYFLWVFFFDPHFVYRPPSPWAEGVEGAGCTALYEAYRERRHEGGQVFSDVGGVASRVRDDCRRLYDAEIAYTDHEIGQLLDSLRRAGRLKNTLVVFTADHGENFGEWGLYFEHGDNAHDAGLRVPLIFHGPEVAAGRRDDEAVSLVDIMPTALHLLDVPASAHPAMDGEDLSPRLHPGPPPPPPRRPRVVFAESAGALWNEAVDRLVTGPPWGRICINGERYSLCSSPREQPGVYALFDHLADPTLEQDIATDHPEMVAALQQAWQRWPAGTARQRVARTGRFKLVQHPRLEGGYATHLYDLQADAAESQDVAAQHPEIYGYLLTKLEAWTATLPDPLQREHDPELEATLRALGYAK